MTDLSQYEGKKICVVFCKLQNEDKFGRQIEGAEEKFDIKTMHGRANIIDGGKVLEVITEDGASFKVPPITYGRIFPNDGTEMLRDAEYFVMVKVSGMEL